jgi:thiamine biosynthesis protein ThiI
LVEALPRDMEKVKARALEMALNSSKKTFKIITKRTDKLFPLVSDQINRTVAGYILQNDPNIKVDVHTPELEIHITVREDVIYIYSESIPGLGGYPVGVAGKALMMISGGIDSPVASFLMMKRGVKLEMIHFAAPPYTSDQVILKIKDLCAKLNIFQPDIKVYIVPFTEIQKKIYEVAGTSYAITIMRRMMLRIATIVAKKHRDLVLASGESIGQVASQTLTSMVAIEKGSDLPIIRPLATYDKLEIIKLSKMIGTFDISIRPYEDCCTIFDVKDPTTCPHIDKVALIESKFDFTDMINEAVKNIQTIHVPEKEEKPF